MSKKNELLIKLKECVEIIKNILGRTIQTLRSDNDGKYLSTETQNYLNKMGIQYQLCVAYCSPQNGVSEKKNRFLVKMIRCML